MTASGDKTTDVFTCSGAGRQEHVEPRAEDGCASLSVARSSKICSGPPRLAL